MTKGERPALALALEYCWAGRRPRRRVARRIEVSVVWRRSLRRCGGRGGTGQRVLGFAVVACLPGRADAARGRRG